jgi:hypothetical protein
MLTRAHQGDSPLSPSATVARQIGRASDGGSEGIATSSPAPVTDGREE